MDGLVEQVVDCGLVVEPNVLSLADAIARVANMHTNSPQILLSWGNNGRENVREAGKRYLTQWETLLWQVFNKS